MSKLKIASVNNIESKKACVQMCLLIHNQNIHFKIKIFMIKCLYSSLIIDYTNKTPYICCLLGMTRGMLLTRRVTMISSHTIDVGPMHFYNF